MTGTVRRVLLVIAVAVPLVVAGVAPGLAGHDDGADRTDFVVHTYRDGDLADQRRPGAANQSYWVEAYLEGLPTSETMYLARSVFYRPVPTDCGARDTDVVGIDRGATYGGQRKVDESIVQSVKAFDYNDDAREEYEDRFGEYGALRTTDWEYVERFEVDWYTPDDFGTPVELRRGDRFVSAEQTCYENPADPGWYRFVYLNTYEFENGTVWKSEVPVFSHWYYICDCEDREAAIDTLGPPPSQPQTTPPATAGSAGGGRTATASDGPADVGGDTPTADVRTDAAQVGTRTATTTRTESTSADIDGSTATRTPTAAWEDVVFDTPTRADGAGFSVVVALLALASLLLRRRR